MASLKEETSSSATPTLIKLKDDEDIDDSKPHIIAVLHPGGNTDFYDASKIKMGKDRSLLEWFKKTIGCSYIEIVGSIMKNKYLVVDEEGKLKDKSQDNPGATLMALPQIRMYGPLTGVAIFVHKKYL